MSTTALSDDTDVGAARRSSFRAAIEGLATRARTGDLLRWVLVPGGACVTLGIGLILLGWVGAARTARQIEQIPYLISGGLLGLAFVFLGGLLLSALQHARGVEVTPPDA
jgi:hypothetical protein